MLEHYFGSMLLVNTGDILESDPPVQAGTSGLGRIRAKWREQNCRCQGRKGDRFDVPFISADAVLQRCYNNR